jgi:hypothetical protein
MNHRLIPLATLAATLSACAPLASQSDNSFGNSVRAAVASQVIDPAAARNANPVSGIDGRAADAAQRHYEASFRKPSAPDAAMVQGSAK